MSGRLLDAAMARAAPVADAVLREGRVLFPYRASALKNRYRWQWGVLAPPAWVEATRSDRAAASVECVADVRADATVAVRVRFVHLETRAGGGAAAGTVDAWDDAVEEEVDIGPVVVPLPGRPPAASTVPIVAAASTTPDPGRASGDGGAAAVVRSRRRVEGSVRLEVSRLEGPWPLALVRLRIANHTRWTDPTADRADALRSSLVAVHAVLAVEHGAFVSGVDPPEFARPAVAACRHDGLWPALIGPVGDADVVLAAPIILPDRPAVAAPSPGDSCDALEIDELLALSVAALGEEERREARLTDPLAAAIVDRADGDRAALARLHASAPVVEPVVRVGGIALHAGARVRLRPRPGADAQDVFVSGRIGVVEAVLHDVDGGAHVAVTIEDDPGADLHRVQGRYRYFRPDELEPPEGADAR